jgi:thiol-disulfide isomerase/thioredoxin
MMLDDIFRHDDLNYGTPESVTLFDNVLSDDSGAIEPSVEKVTRLADYIKSTTLSKGDENMFRQLTGDMLYYLASRSGEGFREGLHYLIDNNITAFPEIWNSPDDSLKVIGFARIMDDLLSKAEPGKPVPAFKLPAERVSKGKSKVGTFRLDRLKGERNIIMFYTEGCEICKAEKAAIRQMASQDRNLYVLFVNVDEIMREMPSVSESLFDSFDLSALPYILEADRKGIVTRRYLSYR